MDNKLEKIRIGNYKKTDFIIADAKDGDMISFKVLDASSDELLDMDADGNEIVSPVEYETLGLMGTNCGLTDPDDLAHLNYLANDLGIDTIETGAMMGGLLDAGLAKFGDVVFLQYGCHIIFS